jgi:cytoskeletal protein RodZ
VNTLKSLGSLLKEQRESKGVSISEASNDLKIKDVILENIEEGNMGAFKDIYVLKEQISAYAKYLGLNSTTVIDEFNEYLFEYTSKIPVKEIERAMTKNSKNEKEELKINSPYTKPMKKYPRMYYLLIYFIIVLFVFILFFWSIKQITINKNETKDISYIK